jgi:hypothetical protein
MERSSRRKAETDTPVRLRPSQEEIIGVADLLLLARQSVLTHCQDEVCVALLDACIDRLRMRYGLSRMKPGGRANECAELAAVVRVLRYARADAIESLGDSGCADLLAECIGRLTRTQLLEQREFLGVLTLH